MSETPLNRLRQKFWLSPLPDSISIPAIGDHVAAAVRPIDEACVDDIAFAIQGLNQQVSALSGQMEALKKLHDMARRAGAIGADAAIGAAMRVLEDA